MGWYWNPVALPGLLALVLSWSAALVVLLSAPRTTPNRILTLLLFAEGLTYGAGNGLLYATDSHADGYAIQALGFLGAILVFYAYLLFVGTIPTPLSRWLARPRMRVALLVAAALSVVAFYVWRPAFLVGTKTTSYARVEGVAGPALQALFLALLFVAVYALVCALDAWRRAPPGPARARAKAFAIAFGARDVGIGLLVALEFTAWPMASVIGFPFVSLLFVPLLAYGVLKSQLFDIDLKIKWTLRRGTVAAIFVAVFFAASEGAAALIESSTGSAVVGIGAAALLVFAIAPLQRAADRFADAAMPHVQETPAYVAYRKMEVYRSAIEAARQDGEVTPKERAVLDALRGSLGLTVEDARAMEVEVGRSAHAEDPQAERVLS